MKRHFTVAMLCGLFGSIVCPAQASLESKRSGRRWALVVSTGGASRGHAQRLGRILVDSYGFGGDGVVLLNDAEATGDRILQAMSTIQSRLQPFDALFVYLSLDQRPDPSAGFSFLPSGAVAAEPWGWVPGRQIFEWLSVLPVGSALVVYPSCPSKFDEYLASELSYGKRPGAIELLRACELSNTNRVAQEPKGSEQWRARLMEKVVDLLQSSASRRAPLSAAQLAARLERSFTEADLELRRVPEYVREGFVFEPVAKGVAGEEARYRAAALSADREAALRNIPGILKAASDPSKESQLAVSFLGDVASSPTARLEAPLEGSAVLTLRTAAVEVLGELRTDQARDALGTIVRQAQDAPWVRRAALTQLSRLTPPRPADLAVVRAAFADPDPSVRESAVRSAVILNDVTAVPELEARLQSEAESTVRVALIQALPALGSRDRRSLIRLLTDPVDAIRREAATALGRLGADGGATAALLDVLRTDPSDEVRRQAASALARTWVADHNEEPFRNVTPALLNALRGGSGSVREAAAHALGQTDGPGAEDALLALLRDGDTEVERIAAAEALGQLRSEAAVPDLVVAVRDADPPGLRRAATAALGTIGTPEALEALVAALDDRDPFVQREAQRGIETIPLSRADLMRGLGHESARVRLAAVKRISESNDPAMVEPLVEALGDAVVEVRQAAAAALASYRDADSIQQVVAATRSEKRLTQFGALSVLASIPHPTAAHAVLDLAQESADVTLRSEALGAVGKQLDWAATVGDREFLGEARLLVLKAAKDVSPAVRKAAAGLLPAFPEGRPQLEELARADPSPEVRSAAIEQLRRSTTPKR